VFISETIEVKQDKVDKRPVEFIWRGKPRYIDRIVNEWQDWGFASGVHKADWRQRRHRNYYRVECDDGCTYEIYLDRKAPERLTWYLYRIVEETKKSDENIPGDFNTGGN
jgi:hypothetical protein